MTESSRSRFDFQHPRFERESAGVRYFAAKRTTVLVGEGESASFRQVCQVTFHKGAVFVQFTYFGRAPGVVGAITPVEDPPGVWQVRLGENGMVAPSLVKYSHPPDGRAHFSQDGQVISKVARQSFPLDRGQGHLFEISAFNPTRFQAFDPAKARRERLYAPFYFPGGIPSAIGVVGMWWPFGRLASIRPPDRDQFGPLERLVNRRTGKSFAAFFLAPPSPEPPTHVMLVNLGPIQLPPGISEPMLAFMGGWDEDVERKAVPGGFLSFMYPISDPEELEARIGSIGFRRADSSAAG